MARKPKALPELKPMDSSVIAGWYYDPATRDFTVKLKSGKVYQYEGVSLERATAFEQNDSPGRYWNTEIKPHHVGKQL